MHQNTPLYAKFNSGFANASIVPHYKRSGTRRHRQKNRNIQMCGIIKQALPAYEGLNLFCRHRYIKFKIKPACETSK